MIGMFFSPLRPDFTSKLVRELAFGTPKFYIAPYDKINHRLVNTSYNCDVKSGLNQLEIIISDLVRIVLGPKSVTTLENSFALP